MIDEPRARELGEGAFDAGDVVLGPARELNEGWLYPCVAKGPRPVSSVTVNKRTGRILKVWTHTPLARDPTLYDRGYQGRFDFLLDRLEEARDAGWFTFKVLEYRGRD